MNDHNSLTLSGVVRNLKEYNIKEQRFCQWTVDVEKEMHVRGESFVRYAPISCVYSLKKADVTGYLCNGDTIVMSGRLAPRESTNDGEAFVGIQVLTYSIIEESEDRRL